jgi:DNA-binding response OmpR family regulator/putative methionine-R-sulfoxide reductase with GAF domain
MPEQQEPGQLELDTRRGLVHLADGRWIQLTTREMALLAYLADRLNRPVSREELLAQVWGYAPGASTRTVDVTVARLRRKLEAEPSEPLYLRTVHGDGYCLVAAGEPVRALTNPTCQQARAVVLRLGERTVDLCSGQVQAENGAGGGALTAQELRLLAALHRAGGTPLDARTLWRQVAPGCSFAPRAVPSAVARLRQKLEPDPRQPRFLCHRGGGYLLLSGAEERRRPGLDCLSRSLWSMAHHVGTVLGFEDCVIYARDAGVLVQVAAHGPKSPVDYDIREPLAIPIGRGIVGSAAASAAPEIVADTRCDPRYIPDVYPGRSELCVPVVCDRQLVGVIDTESRVPGRFTTRERDALQSVAALLAASLSDLAAQMR